MKAKPVLYSVACNQKPYTMMAVDLHEVFLNMQLTNWYEVYGFMVDATDHIYWYLTDRAGYYAYLKAGGYLESRD